MPPKSIAVPQNPSARRGKRLPAAAAPSFEPETASAKVLPPRVVHTPRSHPLHRFHIGERLRMGGGGNIVARVPSFCKVISLLPDEGHGTLLYRVRSDSEQFERIVSEADLSRT